MEDTVQEILGFVNDKIDPKVMPAWRAKEVLEEVVESLSSLSDSLADDEEDITEENDDEG